MRMVNTKRIQLDFDIQDVGSSKVKAVEVAGDDGAGPDRDVAGDGVGRAPGQHLVPDFAGRIFHVRQAGRVDLLDGVAMHLHDAEHRLAIHFIRVERADGPRRRGPRAR